MEDNRQKKDHSLSLRAREHMDICGVNEVISFDDKMVLLSTSCGEMNIEGRDMKIGVLDTERGVVALDGVIDAVFYSEERQKRRGGFFGRLDK